MSGLDWKPVPKSSNIAAVAHDGSALHVKFTSGQVYACAGVEARHLDEIMRAKSAGVYFAKHLRPHHKFEKVETA